ncbi:hypothetical protein Pmani_000842 [Petrolisthes manimaculis]|uniref:Uncharacterized protein n=1 Tax=Petrolisthes manimaculis TaxID=1843537 RepID=A0AAE1QNE6_9EUCA|nr:hypothetical protein Pmani_000842 [Petrolisthes manimaculis]
MRWIVSCLVGLTAVAYLAQGREMEDGRIFAARSVKTAIIVTTSTTVTPLTCAAVLPANTVCQRRRYRSFSLIDLKKKEMNRLAILSVFLMGVLCSVQGRNEEDGRVIVAVKTTTLFTLATSTTTLPLTCATVISRTVCARRRFKRYSFIDDETFGGIDDESLTALDASLREQEQLQEKEEEEEEKDLLKSRTGKIAAFTIESTISSTLTVTVTSINNSITVSVSLFCSVDGFNAPPFVKKMNLLVVGVLLGAVCSAYGRDIDDARIIAARSTRRPLYSPPPPLLNPSPVPSL